MINKNVMINDTLRNLKLPTKLDKIKGNVVKPTGAIPNFGLPRWKTMPLESKIPMVKGPDNNDKYFTRDKLGKALFTGSKDAKFNLNDPYNNEIKFSYDPLHDRHLFNYFARKGTVNLMINQGLINDNKDVLCTVKQYNMYRNYLKNLYNDSLRKAINKHFDLQTDKKVFEMVDKNWEKDVVRLNTQEKLKRKRRVSEGSRTRETDRKRKLKELREKEVLKRLEMKRREQAEKIYLHSLDTARRILQNRENKAKKQQEKVIRILMKYYRKERNRKKALRQRLMKENMRKQEIARAKWQKRVEFQKQQLAFEEKVIANAELERKKAIEKYNKLFNKRPMKLESKTKELPSSRINKMDNQFNVPKILMQIAAK